MYFVESAVMIKWTMARQGSTGGFGVVLFDQGISAKGLEEEAHYGVRMFIMAVELSSGCYRTRSSRRVGHFLVKS